MSTNTDPKDAIGRAKPQLALIPPVAGREMAKALASGHPDYGPWNWRWGKVEIMTYLHAARRHLDEVIEGIDTDAKSGAAHLGHVMANCGIILDAGHYGTLVDNRPPRKPGPEAWLERTFADPPPTPQRHELTNHGAPIATAE